MTRVPRFLLEDHFARYKASSRFHTSSDVEALRLSEVLDLMDDEVRQLWDTATLGYGPTRGSVLLREQIAAGYDTTTAADVHVFSGATEAVYAFMHVALVPGDHAIVIGPIYQLLADLPAVAGANVTRIGLRPDEHWTLDLDRIRAAVTPRTGLIVTNFPNNPTGALPGRAAFGELAATALHAGGSRLLSDELYRRPDPAHDRLLAGVDFGHHVITVSGVSKVLGLAGARMGWVASRDAELVDSLRTYRYWTSLSNSVPSEILALAALRAAPALLDRGRKIVAANQRRLKPLIEDRQDVRAWAPRVLAPLPTRGCAMGPRPRWPTGSPTSAASSSPPGR